MAISCAQIGMLFVKLFYINNFLARLITNKHSNNITMKISYEIITFFIAFPTTVGALVVWYLKKYITENFNKSLEKYKGDIKLEIDKDVESHKGEIQKEIEVLKLNSNQNNNEISRYVDIITRERINWLEKIRADVSEIVADIKVLNNFYNNNDSNNTLVAEHTKKLARNICNFKLRLNGNEDDTLISYLIKLEKEIDSPVYSKENVESLLNNIVNEIQLTLKKEWERVKDEVYYGVEKPELL